MPGLPKFSLLKHFETSAPLICDGAKSSILQHLGLPPTNACFMANLSHPQLVPQAHQAYVKAGAVVSRTNTEGAHRFTLTALDIDSRIENLNNNGMALLREGIGMRGIPAGSITSVRKEVTGEIPLHQVEHAYGEQCIYLSDTGARFLMLSEFEAVEDLQLAVRVAKRSVQKQVVGYLRLSPGMVFSKLVPQLESLLDLDCDFLGIQAAWDYPELATWAEQLVEHFGILCVLLDEPKPLPFGEVAPEYAQISQSLLHQEIAMLGGGRHTHPAHVQKISQLVHTMYSK